MKTIKTKNLLTPVCLILFLITNACFSDAPSNAIFKSNSVKYPDEEWSSFDGHMVERLRKIRELIGRGNKCEVAIYDSSVEDFTLNRSKFVPAALDAYLPKSVHCIADISVGANTIDEKSGCALVSFNSGTDSYASYFNTYFRTAMSSKACKSGGFDELIAMRGLWSNYGKPQNSVEENLFMTTNKKWRYALVYAGQSKYVDWFQKSRENGKHFSDKK